MKVGLTSTQFKYEINEAAADDWETLEVIRKCNDDSSYLVDLAQRLLGIEQYESLKEHCRVDGKISAERMSNEITEMLEGDEIKNS